MANNSFPSKENLGNKNNEELNESASQYNNSVSSSDDVLDLSELYRSIIRQKKTGIYSFLLIFIIFFGASILQRIYRPVYEGSFTMLIKDPFGKPNRNSARGMMGQGSNLSSGFMNLALNTVENDIPTLKAFLKSRKFLEPIS